MSTETRVGSELAGYRLETLVGRGGMGVVYRAYDLALERPVALKILAPELAEDERFRERFLRESRLAASIDHPNIVPVYDAGEVAGELYIAMRYVDGAELKQLLAEGPLPKEQAVAIAGQIAAALDAAHARGLVHRDVKPSNVLVTADGHVYLADFGLTRRLSDQAGGFEAGLSLGTPAYVAPEQIEGKEVDGRADQYSLACLLHECLTGVPPFARSTEAAVALRPPRRGTAGAARARGGASEGTRQGPGPALPNLCGAGRRRPPSARDRLPGAQPLAARGRSGSAWP